MAKFFAFLLQFRGREAFSIIKAYFSLIINLRKILLKRGQVQAMRTVSDKYLKENIIKSFSQILKEFLRLKNAENKIK
jgi:hypothetical protein